MKHDPSDTTFIAITHKNGDLLIMRFLNRGQSLTLPKGAEWSGGNSVWIREPNDANISAEINKAVGSENVVKYRIIEEKDIPIDTSNRKNWKDNGKTIK